MLHSSYYSYTNTYIQAVISCLSDHKASEHMAKIQESQLLKALEYFNLPDSMYPTKIYVRHTHGRTCDKLANQMMITIKAAFVKMAQRERDHMTAATYSRSYKLVYNTDSQDMYLQVADIYNIKETSILINNTLKSHLRALAAAECLAIAFEDTQKTTITVSVSVCSK